MTKWFVVATRPRLEAQAAFNLVNQGYGVFLPQMLKTTRHARQISSRNAPLFPGYLFVDAASANRWHSINSTVGARHILTSSHRPIAVDAGFVEALRLMSVNGVIDFSRSADEQLVAPELLNKVCELARLDEKGRIFVLMGFMAAPP